MFFLNPHLIAGSNGIYGEQANQNLAELRAIMKGLIIRERPQTSQANHNISWASDSKAVELKDTKDSTSQTGGRIWAHTGVYRTNYVAAKKKGPTIKTFAL
jgi:hypothetical protein